MIRRGDQRYLVLFTRTSKQQSVMNTIANSFPIDRGFVFIPKMEYWRRDQKAVATKPLFPGYIFLCSDMNHRQLHEFIKKNVIFRDIFIKELGMGEEKRSIGKKDEDNELHIDDLLPEESEYLDKMLDDTGCQRMSSGYLEQGKAMVMEGPLLYYSDKIVRVDRHERLAYLSFQFRSNLVTTGLQFFPKRHYYPDDELAPQVLSDGYEVDLKKMAEKMMEI